MKSILCRKYFESFMMGLNLKSVRLYRPFAVASRSYCEKTIYQREEEGAKPRTVYGQPYPEWRKPWIQRKGEWKSKFSVFIEKNPNPDILNAMSQIPDLTFDKVKDWWKSMKERQEIHNQKYIQKRVTMLGSNLAAMHFFLYRQGAIRLKDSKHWIKGDITELHIPDTFVDGYFIEAIDCSNFHRNGMRYEGIQNLTGLNFLKWLSLKNNQHIDSWCLDRLAGQNGNSLEYLDISGCKLCVGGILALARMSELKFLVVTDPGDDIDVQTALSMLEQEKPNLLIKTV